MEQTVVTRDSVVALIATSDLAVARAILSLYARQTESERSSEKTLETNGRGFNSHDAEFLTSVAKALPKWNNHMTPRQLARARKLLPKYSRQLVEIAGEKGHAIDIKPKRAKKPVEALYGRF